MAFKEKEKKKKITKTELKKRMGSLAQFEMIGKLDQALEDSAKTVTCTEARFLVDAYYQIQHWRIANTNQISAADKQKDDQPYALVSFLAYSMMNLEEAMAKALGAFADGSRIGQWAQSITGIGPVLSAGLLAHIDMDVAKTPGHITSFAGLNPGRIWTSRKKAPSVVKSILGEKKVYDDADIQKISSHLGLKFDTVKKFASTDKHGKKKKVTQDSLEKSISRRPFNVALKTLCWKIGQSFIMNNAKETDVYGHLYLQRKEIETQKNEKLEFRDQAEKKLRDFNIGKKTEAYKWYSKGMLPPLHISMRAQRWVVKLFLSHWWEVAYECHYGKKPPIGPYAIDQLHHAHRIPVPNWS